MNKIEVPKTCSGAAKEGAPFRRRGALTEDVYVLHRQRVTKGEWTAINIRTGGRWNVPTDTASAATSGLEMLPPGTVVTVVTVEDYT